jgi:hypothetical protein
MRRPICLLLLLVAIASAPPAHAAATSPPGVNLRWDQCYGDGGVQYKQFACDTNTGSDQLVGSFELASGIPGVTGLEITMDIGSASAAFPAWWALVSAGSCRGAALSANSSLSPAAVSCVDWANGQEAGGIAAYNIYTVAANRARLIMGFAVAAANAPDLVPGQEYFAFNVLLRHTKTVGTGACAGCLEPMCIFFSGVNVVPGTNPSIRLRYGANYSGSQWVSWQQGYPLNIQHNCGGMTGGGIFCQYLQTTFDVVPYSPTSARGSTWGQVKALYR